jgi:hypothetical protein
MTRHYWLIMVLAFWMPLQSVAATLLHCHTLDMAVAPADDHRAHAQHEAPVQSSELEAMSAGDCHGDTAKHEQDHATETAADKGPCLHCVTDCHGIQTLSLAGAEQDFTHHHGRLLLHSSPAVLAQSPDNPQRPPKKN